MFPIQDSIPRRSPPIVTWLLIAANAFVFLVELSLTPEQLEALFYLFGVVPARYTHPRWAEWVGFPMQDYWPFLTNMFLHGGWAHVLGNMWTLWIFGDNVEDRLGPGRFFVFYISCGIAAGLTHWFVNADSTVPAVGASGAIAGVMGAYFVLFPHSRIILMVPILFVPFFFELPAIAYLGFWFLMQLVSGAFALAGPEQAEGIAFWAHVGGFVAGMLLLPLFLIAHRPRRFERDEFGFETAWSPHLRAARRRHPRSWS
ncbi:MAG TPA: rhomboid family intramembrane serine protease [bacterium]|nr:rhomboid family intramembrane serine protease [bacterium]